MVKCYGSFQHEKKECSGILRNAQRDLATQKMWCLGIPLKPPGILNCVVQCCWGPGPRCSVWVGLPLGLLLIRLSKFIDPALIHRVKPAMVGMDDY